MVDWDVMKRAKQIISVLPEQYFLGRSVVQTWLVITADAVHVGRGGGEGLRTRVGGGGGGVIERIVLWPLITVKT